MAMITCPECGRQISEYAAMCIGCGAPMEIIKKLLAEAEPLVEPVPAEAESTERTAQEQVTHTENRSVRQVRNRDISCIICGTRFDAADQHCPICNYPVLSLSSNIDKGAFNALRATYRGEIDLNLPLLTRAYTYDELSKLGETVSEDGKQQLASEYQKYVEQGNIFAKANLGMLYFRAYGVEYEEDTAIGI